MRPVMLFVMWFSWSAGALGGANLLGPGRVDVPVGAGRGLVVLFMSSRCPCSNSHVTAAKRLVQDYPEFKFVVVHANTDESLADARAYFTAKDLPFPVIEDDTQALAARFGASRTPHAFVLDKDERPVYRGGISDSHDGEHAKGWPLRDALDDVRAGRKVRRADARALGCAISRGPRASS